MTILPIDELNRFNSELSIHFENGQIRSLKDLEDIMDEMEDLFLLSAAIGVEAANSDLGTRISLPVEQIADIVYQPVAGEVWNNRVLAYYDKGGTEADIQRIAETEMHRITNEAAYDTARMGGATTKTWNCSMLPTSRDTHIYLDGVSAPIDGYFTTFMGNSTLYPGEFGVAEEDVNCLCWLTFN